METNKLNYPIILVHGIGAKDSALFWGRIPQTLTAFGVDCFLGDTDAWSGIESNALSLQKRVDFVLAETGATKVNLIAHSKGGIDARFLISRLGYAPKIASLTTICTPHLGSVLVDYLGNKKYIHTRTARRVTDTIARLYGDKAPDPYKILADLSTENMLRFNAVNTNANAVLYFNYYSAMANRFDDLSYSVTYKLIYDIAGANDGIVSCWSAAWGGNAVFIEGKGGRGISHAEIVDIKRRRISGVAIPSVYIGIVERLIDNGL